MKTQDEAFDPLRPLGGVEPVLDVESAEAMRLGAAGSTERVAEPRQRFTPFRHLVRRPCSHTSEREQGSVVYAVGPARRGVVLILYQGNRSCGVELSRGWARMLAQQLTRSRRVSSR